MWHDHWYVDLWIYEGSVLSMKKPLQVTGQYMPPSAGQKWSWHTGLLRTCVDRRQQHNIWLQVLLMHQDWQSIASHVHKLAKASRLCHRCHATGCGRCTTSCMGWDTAPWQLEPTWIQAGNKILISKNSGWRRENWQKDGKSGAKFPAVGLLRRQLG